MAKIKDLYTAYFQKSKSFLYPALGIKRGVNVTPIETYLGWEDKFHYTDYKLVGLYHLRDDKEFQVFEEKMLLNNPLFDDFIELADNKALYIFDFTEEYKEDWDNIILGRYSKLSPKLKGEIKKYFETDKKTYTFIESYIYPEKYFGNYAELLITKSSERAKMEEDLRNVGELCGKPDLDKEILKFTEVNKEIQQIIS